MKGKLCTAILFFFGSIFPIHLMAGEEKSIATDIVEAGYVFDGKIVGQIIFSVTNCSDENMWLLFEKDSGISDEEIIKERYLKRNEQGMTMFNMMTDGNAIFGDWVYDIESIFLKIVAPGGKFYIAIICDEREMADELISHVRVIPAGRLKSIGGFLTEMDPSTDATYQPDCIAIKLEK